MKLKHTSVDFWCLVFVIGYLAIPTKGKFYNTCIIKYEIKCHGFFMGIRSGLLASTGNYRTLSDILN